MQFMIIATETPDDFARREDQEQVGAYWAAWGSYVEAIAASGLVVSGAGLEPPLTATTLRRREGSLLVEDGPFADTKEQLAGFWVIEVENLDQAIEWASRCPAVDTAAVEVRPVMPMR